MTRDDHSAAPPAADGIYRTIKWLMIADVAIGLALVYVGEAILRLRAMSVVGIGLVIIGGGVLEFFRRLARREAARQARERR